jgi:hypothetical protein
MRAREAARNALQVGENPIAALGLERPDALGEESFVVHLRAFLPPRVNPFAARLFRRSRPAIGPICRWTKGTPDRRWPIFGRGF